MEKKFEVPEYCKSFKVIPLGNGDFEIIYEIEQKRRVVDGSYYYYISSSLEIEHEEDFRDYNDDDKFERGNYFITKELAEEALVYIKNALDEFWKNKSSSN